MSQLKITEMPTASSVNLSDYVPIVQEGINKKVSVEALVGDEADRVEAENKRVQAEADRVAAEKSRVQFEEQRKRDENTRVSNENERTLKEEERISNENSRQSNEEDRVSSESARVSNENTRIENENARIEAENARIEYDLCRKNAVIGGFLEQEGTTYSGAASDYGVELYKMAGKTTQQTTKGYQLFDASKIQTKTQGGATVTNNDDGSFTISGTGNLSEAYTVLYNCSKEESLKLLKVGIVKSNAENTIPQIRFGLRNVSNGTFVTGKCIAYDYKTITLTEEDIQSIEDGTNILSFGFLGNSGNTIIPTTIKPMIYIDGTGEFEPFTGGKPAPNSDYPMEIENVEISGITSHGKNLIPLPYIFGNIGVDVTTSGLTLRVLHDGSIKITGTATKDCYFNLCQVDFGNSVFSSAYLESINGYLATLKNNSDLKLIYDANNKLTYFLVNNGKTIDDILYPMIEKGEVKTEWDSPTKRSTTSTNLTLAQDDIYQNGTITRARKQVTFDGSSDEGWSINVGNVNGYFRTFIDIPDCSKIDSDSMLKIKCNRFATEPSIGYWTNPTKNAIVNAGSSVNGRIAICFDGVSTVDEWKSWLQSNPLTVEYELETPTTEEYQVPTIPSYYPYTNVSTDSIVEPAETVWRANTTSGLAIENKERLDQIQFNIEALEKRIAALEKQLIGG